MERKEKNQYARQLKLFKDSIPRRVDFRDGPITRRSIWSILQNLKSEKRTLILKTHHLDEAEYLSERIAIKAKRNYSQLDHRNS